MVRARFCALRCGSPRLGGGEYSVVEALWSSDPVQDGTRFPVRRFDDPQWQYKFVWLPDDGQRVALLDASERLGLERPRYDWPELVRIAARGAGVKWRRPAGERRLICSHHVARCVVEAAPEFEEFCRVRLGRVAGCFGGGVGCVVVAG